MSGERKILITDDVHPLLIEGLRADGFTVDYRHNIPEEQVGEIIEQYEGLVINSRVYAGRQLLERATRLRFVCRAGSGLEVIDLEYARQKGIAAFNSPEGNRNAVAEHAMGMLLNIMNYISKADAEVRQQQWRREENRGNELSGKTVALIAFGNTAQAFAKLLRGFDVRIMAYDKYYKGFAAAGVEEASLEEIFAAADVVSLHLPLTAETQGMINEEFLSAFKKPYWLLNTSRGKVLHTAAMLQCIGQQKIIGAALDVLENEKLNSLTPEEKAIFEQLAGTKKVLLTPHIAGWTHESKRKIAAVLLQKIRTLYSTATQP